MNYLRQRALIPEQVKHLFPGYETLKFGISYHQQADPLARSNEGLYRGAVSIIGEQLV